MVTYLAFESSCDETAVAYYNSETQQLEEIMFTQIDIHAPYGGVVPELAARNHLEKITILCEQLLQKIDVELDSIDTIAYTKGPGLVGALLVAASFAAGLAQALQKPLIAVNHLQAHVNIAMFEFADLKPPFITMLVSGGHTMLLQSTSTSCHKVLGETLDDAAGEAFDKGAKILGLGYPGGPQIANYARQVDRNLPVPKLPLPMLHSGGMQMSFSGLKTAFMQAWRRSDQSGESKCQFAYALEDSIVRTLLSKITKATTMYPGIPLVLAGGVAANDCLREQVSAHCSSVGIDFYVPSKKYCTDNASMIAYQAALQSLSADGYNKDSGAALVDARLAIQNN